MRVTPDKEQEQAIAKMLAEPTKACLNGSGMGAGKTLVSVEFIIRSGASLVLIICPINTMKDWESTLKRQGFKHQVRVVDSGTEGKEAAAEYFASVPGAYLVGREYFKLSGTDATKPVLPKPSNKLDLSIANEINQKVVINTDVEVPIKSFTYGEIFITKYKDEGGYLYESDEGKLMFHPTKDFKGKVQLSYQVKDLWNEDEPTEANINLTVMQPRKAIYKWEKQTKVDVIIYDEVHSVSNRASLAFKMISKIRAGYRIGCSGTPQRNNFEGFYAVAKWLWPSIIPRSYWLWVSKWAKTEFDPYSQSGKKVVGEKNPGEFVASLPCYIRIESPVEAPKPVVVEVELSEQQRKMYNDMEARSVTYLEENPLVADIPIVQRIRLRQMTLGTVSFNKDGEVDFELGCESTKIDALEELIEKEIGDEPILILVDSKKFIKVVVDRLGPDAVEWSGDVSKAKRDKIKERFLAGELKYIVAVQSAIAEGTDGLQVVCRYCVVLSIAEDDVYNTQAYNRLARRGQPRDVVIYQIVAKDTYDTGILSKHLTDVLSRNASLRKSNE